MAIHTILVCETQVPFVTGGAESLVRSLVDQLRARGYEADLVSLPFKWYPKEEILAHAAAWRLLDLSESNGRPVDLLIATKFPTYCAGIRGRSRGSSTSTALRTICAAPGTVISGMSTSMSGFA